MAKTSGARATPSRTPAPTSAASAAGPSSTATSGSSTVRRSGRPRGHLANWIFVLARTDPDAPKHKGISFLLVPMDQPGVEVRPIAMISGESEFNEVFFTDAAVPEGERASAR